MKLIIVSMIALALLPTALAHGGTFKSTDIQPGTFWIWRFDEYGTVTYHCHQHPNMAARVYIAREGPRLANVTIQDSGFEPSNVTIVLFGAVNWTNQGAQVHSVYQNTSADEHAAHSSQAASVQGWATGAALGIVAWAARRRR